MNLALAPATSVDGGGEGTCVREILVRVCCVWVLGVVFRRFSGFSALSVGEYMWCLGVYVERVAA